MLEYESTYPRESGDQKRWDEASYQQSLQTYTPVN